MKLTHVASGLALAFALPALAASLFDGTWKADVATAKPPTKPDVLLLQDGVFTCKSCVPSFTVKADGAFHPVTGMSYTDEIAVKVNGPQAITETDKLKGKVINTSTFTVAPDGKTALLAFTDTSAPDGKPTTGEVKQKRVAAATAGAHAVSGSWQTTGYGKFSDSGLTATYALVGDTLTMKSGNGYHFSAKLGGKPVPIVGDTANAMAAVRKTDANTIEETDSINGKIVSVATMTVAPDGKTAKVDFDNRKQGTKISYTMTKQ
jgi:hypothetical protein